MASSNKWTKTKNSLLELGKLLTCEGCHQMAETAHLLGSCYHTFCLPCTESHIGNSCPVCQKPSDVRLSKHDLNIENLAAAYRDVAQVFGLILQDKVQVNEPDVKIQETKTFSAQKGKRTRKNSIESLDSSVMSCVKIDKRNPKGETPLHVASGRGNLQKVKDLLLQGANPNTKDNAGSTPLHDAICKGHEDIVRLLLENGAQVNIPGDENETPLHDAVACGKINIVKLLTQHGADVNARNSRGLTPCDLCVDNEMKAILNGPSTCLGASIIVPQQERRPVHDGPLIVCGINLDKKTVQRVSKLSRPLGFKAVSNYSGTVTHVLVRPEDANVKANVHFYSAVLRGQWILDFKWIEESEKSNDLKDPSEYELDAMLNRAPLEGSPSRRNALQQLPGLFNKCHFYLHGDFGSPNKNDLTTWIKMGGGTLLTRMPNPENINQAESVPYHAKPESPLARCSHFILYDSHFSYRGIKYNMSHIKALSVDWFISCMDRFDLCDPF